MSLSAFIAPLATAIPYGSVHGVVNSILGNNAQKKQIEQLFSDGKVSDSDIEAKANELQKIIQTLENKEERWFELSSKME